MGQVAIFIDIDKCTACRACQVACKNWNQLKGEQTENRGTHENPPDLSANTWNRIKFVEANSPGGKAAWAFFSTRCRHCDEPGCMYAAQKTSADAIVQDPTGAVLFTPKTKDLSVDDIRPECPYDIPRKDEASGQLVKCTLCVGRITNGLTPACVKACSTGALSFGPKDKMLDQAKKRIAVLGKDANLYPGEAFSTLWALPEKPAYYGA
jgi:formate dehydrogenase iron-sulfur subunit